MKKYHFKSRFCSSVLVVATPTDKITTASDKTFITQKFSINLRHKCFIFHDDDDDNDNVGSSLINILVFNLF